MPASIYRLVAAVGGATLVVATELGAIVLVLARIVRTSHPARLDRDETLRALGRFGVQSLPIVLATAAFTGVLTVLQSAVYVERYGVHDFVGWYSGFVTFREVGPVLVGLMFSGRVGASNTSELATMAVTEQLDALRVLALDVYELLIVPRTVAMVLALAALVVYGDAAALAAGALSARWLLGIDFAQFGRSLFERLTLGDLVVGIEKGIVFGLVIAVVSAHFGLTARGGSAGVGRAVHAQVVAGAVSLFVADYLMTSLIR